MSLSQNEAWRFVSVIDERIKKALGRGTVLEITYGTVDVVSGRYCSVFIGGDTNASGGFRIPTGMALVSGDRVRVTIDPRGDRYISEVIAPTDFPKAAIDPVRGSLLLGDGSVSGGDGSAGQYVRMNGAGTALEYGDLPTDPTDPTFTTVTVGSVTLSGAAGMLTVAGDATVTGDLVTGNADITGSATLGNNLTIEGGVINFGSGGADAILYTPATGTLKTDEGFEGASLAIGTNKVARWVPLTYQAVNATRSSNLATADIELTSLPATGVVAVTGYILTRTSDTGGNQYAVYHYDGTVAGQATCTGVATRYGACSFIAKTGGANNRTIKHEVAYLSGSQLYIMVVTGYWTTE